MTTEARGLAILVCSPTPETPELCVTPLIHAAAACALDCEVEIHFAGPAVRLLVKNVPEHLFPTPAREKSVHAFMQDAVSAGARLLACSMAQATWIANDEHLIPECAGTVGATAYVARALDCEWRTLVF